MEMSPPVHAMRGSMTGGERRSKRNFHFRLFAVPDVIAEREGR
jgi:hypothetical protein